MDDVRGLFLGMPHGTTPAAVTTNKNIKIIVAKPLFNRKVITNRSKAVVLLWFFVTYFCVSFGDVSSCVCPDYFQFGLGC